MEVGVPSETILVGLAECRTFLGQGKKKKDDKYGEVKEEQQK